MRIRDKHIYFFFYPFLEHRRGHLLRIPMPESKLLEVDGRACQRATPRDPSPFEIQVESCQKAELT